LQAYTVAVRTAAQWDIARCCYTICMDSKIIVYGAEWCGYCHEAMHYLDKLGVKYTYKNIDLNPDDAREVIEKSHQTGIPVLDVDGTIIIGFDRPRLDEALKQKQLV
jgi:glutaredoxin